MHPGATRLQIAFYRAWRGSLALLFTVLFNYRSVGHNKVPATGPLLIVANHQSFLDPPAVGGLVTQRNLDFLARAGLFKSRLFGGIIRNLNAVPVREDGLGDTAAIKEILRRLKMGRAVMIFPEGSRTYNGAMQPFKRGVALIVKRARCPVIPAAIDGGFDTWPRTRRGPKAFGCPIAVRYGDVIAYDELMRDGAEAGLARLHGEIDALRVLARADIRRRTRDRYPAVGPADHEADPERAIVS